MFFKYFPSLQFKENQWPSLFRPVAPLWCDLGCWLQTSLAAFKSLPMLQTSTCCQVLASAWLKCSKTEGNRCTCYELIPCQWRLSARLPLTQKKIYRESSNFKVQVSVHWQTQWHMKWPRSSREFQHPAGFEPILPYSLRLSLTTDL